MNKEAPVLTCQKCKASIIIVYDEDQRLYRHRCQCGELFLSLPVKSMTAWELALRLQEEAASPDPPRPDDNPIQRPPILASGSKLAAMTFPIVTFGKTLYKISDPDAAWFQRSAGDAPECGKCGDTLFFTFPPRTDPQVAGFAGSYCTPTGIRCKCFVVDGKLTRDPVPIMPISVL